MEKNDPVNHPAHYTQYKHEVIELTEQLDFCLGNAVKYILRAPFKGNAAQDYQKALWYVKRERDAASLGKAHISTARTIDEATLNLAKEFENPLVRKVVLWAKVLSEAKDAETRKAQFALCSSLIVDLQDTVIDAQKNELMTLKLREATKPSYPWKDVPIHPWKDVPILADKVGDDPFAPQFTCMAER